MAQIRGSWFPNVHSSLVRHGLLVETDALLPALTRTILHSADLLAWYDEAQAVAIYEAVASLRKAPVCRSVGRDAARYAMVSTWRDMINALIGFIGGTPRMAFEQFPVLWNASRRDAGELRCVESSSRHAVTELRDFPFASNHAWTEVWLGHHDALLRQLRFGGEATLVAVDPSSKIVRVRTSWRSALGGSPTDYSA
ncbi:MAG: hypothetical protein NVSMB1_14510 [Polyangiales bacterium]